MSKAITIRADDRRIEQLDELARRSALSRNYLIHQALREFLQRRGGEHEVGPAAAPVAERLEDYRIAFWQRDDCEAFRAYLEGQRQASPLADKLKRLE